jgi:hypothetical protein
MLNPEFLKFSIVELALGNAGPNTAMNSQKVGLT